VAELFEAPHLNGRAPLTRSVWLAIGSIALGVVILGAQGIRELGNYGWPTVAYGVVMLFAVGTDLTDVPWRLEVARLLAPLVTVSVVLLVAARAARNHLTRMWLRRTVRGHSVFVGPPDRLSPYLNLRQNRRQWMVLLGPYPEESARKVLWMAAADYSDDRWIERASVPRAHHLVLATGSDHHNLELLAEVIHQCSAQQNSSGNASRSRYRMRPARRRSIQIEIDNRETALQLSTTLHYGGAEQDWLIDVICPIMCRAVIAAERLVSTGSTRPIVAVVGDGRTTGALAVAIAERFAHSPTDQSGRRPLLVVAPEREQAAKLLMAARLDVSSRFEVQAHASTELLEEWSIGPLDRLAVYVEFEDADRSAAVAVDIASRRRHWRVYLATGRTGRPLQRLGVGNLESFGAVSSTDPRLTAGLFTLVAISRHESRRTRGDPNASTPWDSLSDDLRREELALVVAGVTELLVLGLRLVALIDRRPEQPDNTRPCNELTTPQRTRLEHVGLGPDADNFPAELRSAGILLLEQADTDPQLSRGLRNLGAVTAPTMPPDDVVESMARAIHQQYLNDQHGYQDSSHPAMRPWEHLAAELRSQNIDQARHNVTKLAGFGFTVVAASQAQDVQTVELTATDIERLAQDEHDRWAREKRANGYRYGLLRCDEPPDLRHPDLVAWEELDEATREKDRSPVRAMLDRLAEAGYVVMRSA
jgi:hypothetical protein